MASKIIMALFKINQASPEHLRSNLVNIKPGTKVEIKSLPKQQALGLDQITRQRHMLK